MLCDTKRIIYISSIIKVFLEILLKSTNSYIVEIQVPMKNFCKINIDKLNSILSKWFSKKKIETQFEQINFNYFKEPFLIYTIKQKPELLAGFTLNFMTESKIIDLSVSTKIQKISKILDY